MRQTNMPRSTGITYSEEEKAMPIQNEYCDWYAEYGIVNQTGSTIYALQPNGHITEIPADGTVRMRPYVEISMRTRLGREHTRYGYRGINNEPNRNSFLQKVRIDSDILREEGIYVDKITGIILAIADCKEYLKLYVRNSTAPIVDVLTQAIREQDGEDYLGKMSGFTIMANCHNTSLKTLYIVLNNRIVNIPIKHCFTAPEMLVFFFRSGGDNSAVHTIEPRAWDWALSELQSIKVGLVKWIVGTDYSKVAAELVERNNKRSKLVSLDILNKAVEDKTKELTTVIDQKDEEIKILQDKIRILESKIKVGSMEDLVKITAENYFRQKEFDRKEIMAAAEHSYRMKEMGRKESTSERDAFAKSWPTLVTVFGAIASGFFTYMTKHEEAVIATAQAASII